MHLSLQLADIISFRHALFQNNTSVKVQTDLAHMTRFLVQIFVLVFTRQYQ